MPGLLCPVRVGEFYQPPNPYITAHQATNPVKPRRIPDYARAVRALPPGQRETVREWEIELGLPPGGGRHCPPLRELVGILAALRLAGQLPGLSSTALGDALEELGVEDDCDLGHAGNSMSRRLRRWLGAAYRDPDTGVRPPRHGSA